MARGHERRVVSKEGFEFDGDLVQGHVDGKMVEQVKAQQVDEVLDQIEVWGVKG